MTIDFDKMRACPNCGSTNFGISNRHIKTTVFYVVCHECPFRTQVFKTPEAAVGAWNLIPRVKKAPVVNKPCPFCGDEMVQHHNRVWHSGKKKCFLDHYGFMAQDWNSERIYEAKCVWTQMEPVEEGTFETSCGGLFVVDAETNEGEFCQKCGHKIETVLIPVQSTPVARTIGDAQDRASWRKTLADYNWRHFNPNGCEDDL